MNNQNNVAKSKRIATIYRTYDYFSKRRYIASIVVLLLHVYVIVKWFKNYLMKLVHFIKTRPGGYLRILKCGFRKGDNAPMAIVELVDRRE